MSNKKANMNDKKTSTNAKKAEKLAKKTQKKEQRSSKKAEKQEKSLSNLLKKEKLKAEKEKLKEDKQRLKAKVEHRKELRRIKSKSKDIKWDKLDNTANLFPVIANHSVSNVYRISVTLKEEINGDILQDALDDILPQFDVFNVRLRKGIFWYYFETNRKEAPWVEEESNYPCRYIDPQAANNYLFRVTYYKNRINLEAFHALTDGNGAFTFLKELTYKYLRLTHKELEETCGDGLSSETSLNKEDSYLKNYKKSYAKSYKTEKAYILKGEKFADGNMGIIHGHINLKELKAVSKARGVSINSYLVALVIYSIYKEYLHEAPGDKPISACVPVNLRPYFNSITTKNFFAVVTANFKPENASYTFDEVLDIVADGLKKQINRENLEKLFSYNVSNEMSPVIRMVPLFVKNLAMKYVYRTSARANTLTITNLGIIDVIDEYKKYIDDFYVILSMSSGQNLKCGICSYEDELVFTFSSSLKDTSVQKAFFRTLSEAGVHVTIESNGVYYE